ncbi:hypothetical protein [Sphingomonas sp. NFR15]|uniref:hypothetical protein n=1 Tax=Sphingomonas sp. NFR15 TaxID=1566282 RepID=UPI00088FB0DB|nr:hypothetical protein [Sphingomonas sp. NFR15]SDA36271.1 hypothetical protein SAMN03159340_03596 [Sphingomonas sp. NFR15]
MAKMVPIPQPTARRLRVYAFDPNASLDLGSAKFSHATIALAWSDPTEEPISVGPVNEYLEVIDIDPASRQFYPPLDLNAPDVLGQDGLPPSEGDPRFHQQMVFAVAMKTIKLFERALGRKVIWAPAWDDDEKTYVPTLKLRVYPHALREANAYYSRDKRALLFGYFNATQRAAGASWIFTALSHDIIVHETTHAILDGLHPRYSEPTSIDSLAFHEAFADIAALFSHFQLYEAVYDYIEKNAGHLDQIGLLSGLAGQFAKGTSGHPSLRDFIDTKPDANLIENTDEPHDRGSILVAAVFDAFLSIYSARTVDLLRMCGLQMGATGPLHPDLVARLTGEATKSADHVLRMCIRALDYLPPVDVRFGEFLRAIITADADLIPDDRLNYRLAFIEAFRRRGIFPEHCLSMSPDNLLWDAADPDLTISDIDAEGMNLVPQYRRGDIVRTAEENRRKVWYWLTQPELRLAGPPNAADEQRFAAFRANARAVFAHDHACTGARLTAYLADIDADLAWLGISEPDREKLAADLGAAPTHFARWETFLKVLTDPTRATNVVSDKNVDRAWERELGLFFQRPSDNPLYTIRGGMSGLSVEVASVRTTRRTGPDGQDIRQLVIEITQRRRGYFDAKVQAANDATPPPQGTFPKGDFIFRGGATVIIDLRDNTLRYVITKRIDDDVRLDRQRQHLLAPEAMGFTYDPAAAKEPFAMLHRM